jgi:hypothetical protein
MNKYRQKLLNEIGITKEESILKFEDWFNISTSSKLSEEFIREFKDLFHWNEIRYHHNLSDDFLIEFQDRLNWTIFFMNVHSSFRITKKFIMKADSSYFQYFKLSHFNEHQINELQRILDLHNIFRKDKFKLEKII